ncbi:hypothetical protein B0J11DRAFT_598032 [Dendryphion nanum]|uniref:Uncharacterized protein n=1 Tax=Dendryphion nanum TaxID=256645 RepID=A0A9P9D3M1_9PLEO|nr:hypothetical protein B0J11DRAFT_598032 [Dendryphion nanum]
MPPLATSFEFVSFDPVSNPKPGKTLQVRSRCMQGKNKREGSRRTQRENRRLAKEKEKEDENNDERTKQLHQGQQPGASLNPLLGTMISDLALVHFPSSNIDHEAKALLFKAFAYNVANQSLSPLDRAVDFDCLESASFEWMFTDSAFMHSVLCASYAINDFLAPNWDGTPGQKTVLHLRKTLSLLQTKLHEDNVHHDESVLQVVMNLALLAAVYADWDAAAAHFKGMHRIIQLRGAQSFLRARPKLHFKLDRIDLAWSLSSGKPPFFLHPTVAWGPIIHAPYLPLPENLYRPPNEWDYRLANVFQDFQFLSLQINRNALKRARHNAACFQAVLTSLQSRLMHLGRLVDNPVEELVPGRKIPYAWVIRQLGDAYSQASNGPLKEDKSLMWWVLISVAFTITGSQEYWVKEAWKRTEAGLEWTTVKSHLIRIMWIELIHDDPGKLIFERLEDTRST